MFRTILACTFLVLSFPAQALYAGGRVLTIDDFQDGDRRAASGLSWISIADDLMGGASHADLQVVREGQGRALKVAGEVAAGGFAGAWVALDGRARAADISDFTGVRLRLRGQGTLQVALRAGPMPGYNYAATVAAGPDWTQVDVPFDTLAPMKPGHPPFDRKAVRWIGVSVRGEQAGPFEFAIDDVRLYAGEGRAALRVADGPTMTQAFSAAPASAMPQGPWTELAGDAVGDGRQGRLPDATALALSRDDADGLVWFRIALAGPVPERWLGVNLALDVDGDPGNGMEWWGANTAFHFDRVVTAYGSATGEGYEGTIGIADAAEVQKGDMAGSRNERVVVVLDRTHPAIVVGIPRSALGTSAAPVRVVAAVGSAFQHNDDVPDAGAATLPR